jgi:hypothetical protein
VLGGGVVREPGRVEPELDPLVVERVHTPRMSLDRPLVVQHELRGLARLQGLVQLHPQGRRCRRVAVRARCSAIEVEAPDAGPAGRGADGEASVEHRFDRAEAILSSDDRDRHVGAEPRPLWHDLRFDLVVFDGVGGFGGHRDQPQRQHGRPDRTSHLFLLGHSGNATVSGVPRVFRSVFERHRKLEGARESFTKSPARCGALHD